MISAHQTWFGQHGRVTVDEARAAALEILAATKKGIDPRDANAKREAEPVMAELGRRFLEEYVPVHCKPSTQGEYATYVSASGITEVDGACEPSHFASTARQPIPIVCVPTWNRRTRHAANPVP